MQTELVVPPLTPFTGAGTVDWSALRAQIDYIIETCRATQIVAAGVEAQEYQFLDLAMRRELIRRTVEWSTREGVCQSWSASLIPTSAPPRNSRAGEPLLGELVSGLSPLYSPLNFLFILGSLIPSLAVSVRQLHDMDLSGWLMLLVLSGVGITALLYLQCLPGALGANRFGALSMRTLSEA
jgi:hypothetical protein